MKIFISGINGKMGRAICETAEREITTYTFSLGYGGTNPGASQKYTSAGVTDANNNIYRCALLRMEVPVLNSMGTLRYTLVKATF